MDDLLAELAREIERQDRIHPAGFPNTRDGQRAGIAAMEDELDETKAAWRDERSIEGWPETHMEAMQVAAIAVRMIRDGRVPDADALLSG